MSSRGQPGGSCSLAIPDTWGEGLPWAAEEGAGWLVMEAVLAPSAVQTLVGLPG